MFLKNESKLKELGATITAEEILQQPTLWKEVLETYENEREKINTFISNIKEKYEKVTVIFTGAGTSAYVGEIIAPYLRENQVDDIFDFQPVATTSLVSNPKSYFKKDVPTLLVSFARSGNSPESIAAVNSATELIDNLYEITITCAKDGKLAARARKDEKNLLLLMPEKSNDQGFAMTGSFSCMTLMSLLAFDSIDLSKKQDLVESIINMSNDVISRGNEIQELINKDFERVVYLGSGPFLGLSKEVQLKILELTAGKIATLYESSLGFRHGPKSFVNEKALIFMFIANDEYARQYDIDMLNELKEDNTAALVCGISTEGKQNYDGKSFSFKKEFNSIPDGYLVLPFAIIGQLISLFSSIKVGIKPDTPFPSGELNRVVKGVTIYTNL